MTHQVTSNRSINKQQQTLPIIMRRRPVSDQSNVRNNLRDLHIRQVLYVVTQVTEVLATMVANPHRRHRHLQEILVQMNTFSALLAWNTLDHHHHLHV